MLSSLWTALATALLLTRQVVANNVVPSNNTIPTQSLLNLTVWYGTVTLAPSSVVPLTASASNAKTNAIQGAALLTTSGSQLSITSNTIAFISCDPNDYTGNIQAIDLYGSAVQSNAAAIVFFSQTGLFCNPNSTLSYSTVYSMTSQNDTQALILGIRDPVTWSTQIGGDRHNTTSGTDNGLTSPAPGTALAMIILYAITGVITALFVLIIITGTIRAHRHPERYGPRTIDGRPKQTRAGGLARAMLDTIPVVKFGERAAPKPDVELAEGSVSYNPDHANPQSALMKDAVVATTTDEGGIAAASSSVEHADTLGCSICTEDFEVGQDQRVLPCDHRFHPACIDPWLLNVSGTCPLCRIDLRPQDEVEEQEPEAEPATEPVAARRRSVLMAITGFQRPDRMTREERVQALRRYRFNRQPDVQASAGAAQPSSDVVEDEGSRRNRLRRLFNVRTRRTTTGA